MAAKKRMRNNFRQAMNELVNGEAPAEDNGSAIEKNAVGEGTEDTGAETGELEIIELEDRADNKEGSPFEASEQKSADQADSVQESPVQANYTRLESVITEDMVIEGNIITKSDLKLFGSVTGDVTCEGNIYMTGSIEGEVAADSLKMQSGNICGNVHSNQDIIIEREAGVKGDIRCQRLIMNGQVEGSIVTTESIELQAAAVLIGNATSGNISVHNGAKVKGLIQIGEV